MRRLLRLLFTLCAAVSLLLCVATCAAWVRNFFAADWAIYVGASNTATYNAERNVTRWMWYYGPTKGEPGFRVGVYAPPAMNAGLWDELNAFGHRPFNALGVDVMRESYALAVYVPHWLLAAVTAVLPLAWLRLVTRSHRRRTRGQCAKCGYDLRASPDRCPECGTPTNAMLAADKHG